MKPVFKTFILSPASLSAVIAGLGLMSSASAASVALTLDQSAVATAYSIPINVTAQGTMDWGLFLGNGLTVDVNPLRSMAGGVGFTSLTGIGGITDLSGTWTAPENQYSWTNGEAPNATGSTTNALGHERWTADANGEGVRMTIDVASAGTYQLKLYTTTGSVGLTGKATLASSPLVLTDTEVGTNPSVVQNFYWTVDFVTDGADTLTLDVTRSGGSGSVFAVEAFTLVPEPSSALLGGLGCLLLLRRRR